MTGLKGVLFDKDGTLFDFNATWAPWARQFLERAGEGDHDRSRWLGTVLGYDYDAGVFAPDSVVIAHSNAEIADVLAPHLGRQGADALMQRLTEESAAAPMAEAVPLAPLMAGLRGRGLRLGVATNDAEAPAQAHLAASGLTGLMDFVAGFDSGHGAKPAPGMLLAFARMTGLAPGDIAMVGDSRHDLQAGRTAGMVTVAVLTGLAPAEELAPLADVVLPDIGHLPGWLGH